jgi:hypothetical protein
VIPFACGNGLCWSNCPTHRGGLYLFPHTHTKQKEQLKSQTPKTTLKKPKEGEEKNQQEKTEINKNYKKI